MYIKYNNNNYSCNCTINKNSIIYKGLPEDFHTPAEGEIILCADDGFEMRTDNTADYLRQTFNDGVLTLTNLPEPTVVESEESTETPVSELEQLRADIDYISIMTGVEL